MMKQQYKTFFRDTGVALGGLALIFLFTGALLVCLLLTGCTKKVYVPVEHTVTRIDTLYKTNLRVDSVIMRDSISVVQIGDTVRITQFRDRIKVKERTDTVYQSLADTVRVRDTVPVERTLNKWEQTKMDFGGMALGGLCAAVLAAVVVWIIKIKIKRRK